MMIPFFLDHYLNWIDKIIIYDNQSTDNSKSLLISNPKIEVREWETENELRDDLKTRLMNEMWKESRGKADWVIVCDFDEFLFHPNIKQFLTMISQAEFTVCRPLGFDMISEKLPNPQEPLIRQITMGMRNHSWDKMVLFDPNKIERINFTPGGHYALPEGKVKVYFSQQDLKLLHYRYLSEDYIVNKHKSRNQRLSSINKQKGWGQQYTWPELKQRQVYRHILQNSVRVL